MFKSAMVTFNGGKSLFISVRENVWVVMLSLIAVYDTYAFFKSVNREKEDFSVLLQKKTLSISGFGVDLLRSSLGVCNRIFDISRNISQVEKGLLKHFK